MADNPPTWLITGCARGIGRALAQNVAAAGMNLAATARNVRDLDDFPILDSHVHRSELDVADPEQVARAVRDVVDRFGAVDVLVNNATGSLHGAIEEVEPVEYRRLFETNVFGPLGLIRAVLPQMRTRRSGTIVNFSSLGGLAAQAGLGHYSATKFAVEAFSEAIALECAPFGIRVIIAIPTSVRTDWAATVAAMSRQAIAEYDATSGRTRRLLADRAGKQPGDPDKAARAVIDAVLSDDPPFRLFLGAQGLDRVSDKLVRLEADLSNWRDIAFEPASG